MILFFFCLFVLFVLSFVCPFIRPFIHSFSQSFSHSSIHSVIHSVIHSFKRWFNSSIIGRVKRAPHWAVQSRFRVIYVYVGLSKKICMPNAWAELRGPSKRMLKVSLGWLKQTCDTLSIHLDYFSMDEKRSRKKRSIRNEKLKANRASETEEQRKERLKIRCKKDRARRRTKKVQEEKKKSSETEDHQKQRLATLKS